MRPYALPAIFVLGMILRIGYVAAIYEPTLLVFHGGDYDLYRIGAEAILHGNLAFTHDTFLVRPPLFPILVAILAMNPFAILAVNIVLGACIIPLTYLLGRQFNLSRQMALFAALVLALDPTSVKYSGTLQAEALANVLLACALVSLMALKNADTRKSTVFRGLLSGAFIVLSALARPAAYLLWIPMACWIVVARQRWRVLAVSALVVSGTLGTELWRQHNAVTFENYSYSTIGNYNMLYYRAASVLLAATGKTIDDVYAELARRVEAGLGNETTDITSERRHHHYAGSSKLQSVMTSVSLEVFLDHPMFYLLTLPAGIYRILFKVSGAMLVPGIAWNVALLLAGALGLKLLLSQRRWAHALMLLLPCCYFLMGTLLVQTSGIDTRARVMVTPLLAVMAAYGALYCINRRKEASANP